LRALALGGVVDRFDRLWWIIVGTWVISAALVGLTLEHHVLMPLMMVPLGVACTLTAVGMLRPNVYAADEVLRLGIEIGERRARKALLPKVVPIRRHVCECGGVREDAVGH
jgi:hypothetical protein